MLYEDIIRPILFKLSEGDAEEAHLMAKRGIITLQYVPPILATIDFLCQAYYNEKPVEAFGVTFPNKVGLAAGLDKNGEMLPFWQALGFGFAEIGAVLPNPQVGNPRKPKPRLYRVPEYNGLINRMGFNSDGHFAVVANLQKHLPKMRIPIGINMGKMKGTPLEAAGEDYCAVLRVLYPYGSYFVINVSSPNTPELRELQTPKFLGKLVSQVVGVSNKLGGKPVLIKFDPDMTDHDTIEAVEVALENGIRGVILTNTTTTRPESGGVFDEMGGMSGDWVFFKALHKVRIVRKHFPDLPIIGVSGINGGERHRRMLGSGATLTEILTGLIYRGPVVIEEARFNR